MADAGNLITPEMRSWIGRQTPFEPAAYHDDIRYSPLRGRHGRSPISYMI